jgi:hypothetical protein
VSAYQLLVNVGAKAARRLRAAPRPLVRLTRRYRRDREPEAFRRDIAAIHAELARVAAGRGPIVVGPWLAEVGYEVLYWIPFVRWFTHEYRIARERLVVVSRGGMEPFYAALAGAYIDLFDLFAPAEFAVRNATRRRDEEAGGQKQSAARALDMEIVAMAAARAGISGATVCHPSLMFRLFRQVWHGNLPFDVLWRHVRYVRETPSFDVDLSGLPDAFIAAKLYVGPALSPDARDAVTALVTDAARRLPVVTLDADLGLDEHADFDLGGLPGAISARALLTPRRNLAVQAAIIARSRLFLGACGGLAWTAPFLGVPTVALYDSDRLLAPHLFVARQAGLLTSAAPFSALDLSALARLHGTSPVTAVMR